jgi:DNA mismatch repair protein MSH2
MNNDHDVMEQMEPHLSSQGNLSLKEFVSRLLSLRGSHKTNTFHFFEKLHTFTCYEYQALFIADEFYNTRYSIRLESGLESLSLSKMFFKKVCFQILQKDDVCIWGKRTKELNSPYELLAKGSPGNIRPVEDILGGFADADVVGDYVAGLYLNANLLSRNSVSLVYFNDSDYHLSVVNFSDDGEFSRVRSMIAQFSIQHCFLLTLSSGAESNNSNSIEVLNLTAESSHDEVFVPEEVRKVQNLKRILEDDLNVFVDTVTLKDFSSEKDKHNAIAEFYDLVDPIGFSNPLTAESDTLPTEKNDIQRVQRLQDIEESFRDHSGALLTSLAALRRHQRSEKLRHRDASNTFQVPISFSVRSDDKDSDKIMLMDQATISSLQLVPSSSAAPFTSSSSKRQAPTSLFRLLDRTCTTMGRRLLQSWIVRPSAHLPTIRARQQSISYFIQNNRLTAAIREGQQYLKQYPDLEKLVQKLRPLATIDSVSRTGNRELRDLLELYKCVVRGLAVCELVEGSSAGTASTHEAVETTSSVYVKQLLSLLQQCRPLMQLIEEILDAEHLQASYARTGSSGYSKEGEALFRERFLRVKPSLTPELESHHQQLAETQENILKYFKSLPAIVGVEAKDLHLEQSDVHGIHLRVTKRLSSKVLKSLESQKIVYRVLSQQKAGMLFLTNPLDAMLKKLDLLQQIYESNQLVIVVSAMNIARTYIGILQSIIEKIAILDVLMSLANVSLSFDWAMPTLFLPENEIKTEIHLKGMYHPLLRERLGANQVVTSDVCMEYPCLSRNIFGPNMGGKSTFLKAVGTIIVLAQMGCPVPCRQAQVPVLERLFLRTGAAESSALGMSSFLAEMNAMSELLRLASSRSLVLIDEIGRGTSTSDGFGLAWAILEELAIEKRAIVLCATHFHELVQLEDVRDVNNAPVFGSLHVDANVDTQSKKIQMLYKVLPGSCNRSYGTHCAQLAGFPDEIVANALAIESFLENDSRGLVEENNRQKRVRSPESPIDDHHSKKQRVDVYD